jgi:hypothetical protein
MKTVLAILSVVLLLGFCQCNRNANRGNPLLGQYELVAHDNSGQLAFTGTITVQSVDQNHLKGQCLINRQNNAPNGVLDNNAGCEALVDGKKVSFDLAPLMDDAGLLLDGELNDSGISGIWKLDGFVTSGPLGKFEAVKKGASR